MSRILVFRFFERPYRLHRIETKMKRRVRKIERQRGKEEVGKRQRDRETDKERGKDGDGEGEKEGEIEREIKKKSD